VHTCGRTIVFELSAHTTSTLLLRSTLHTWPTDLYMDSGENAMEIFKKKMLKTRKNYQITL